MSILKTRNRLNIRRRENRIASHKVKISSFEICFYFPYANTADTLVKVVYYKMC